MQTYFLTRNELLFADKHATLTQRLQIYKRLLKWFYWRVRKTWAANGTVGLPTKAMAHAIRDYALRRFGDCPAVVRRYDAIYRQRPYMPSSFGEASRGRGAK
jgi:hypothetical protein